MILILTRAKNNPKILVIKNFWVMGEFLEQGKPKKRKIDRDLLERKEIIKKYKAKVSAILNEVEKSKETEEVEVEEKDD